MRRLLVVFAIALAAPAAALAQPGDWGAQRNPFDPAVIARYKAILARNPHDPSALAKLLELYRRYSTVDALSGEYGKAIAAKPEWASLVVLGRLMHATGDDVRALDLWTRAVALKDDDAETWKDIGELERAAGHNQEARSALDKALAHATGIDTKKRVLRALADLALATGDNDGANAYFQKFLDLDPKNAQLWIERGDAMLAAGKRDIALESYTAAEKLLGSDPAKRVEIVARRGQALEGMGKDDEAVAEYRRAIKLAPKGYYLETELTGRIIDIYRRKQALAQLLAQYEKEWPEGARGHFEWDTLGKLYEETGSQDKAIAALKKAVAKAPWELETQRRLIQLLENSGRDDEALAQYEAVVRAAPGEARFQLELAERYWRRGDDKKALEALARLEARFPSDPSVLSAIADLYTRWDKQDLAIAEYERLAKLEPDDPGHLVTLGEQYFEKGDAANKARALATWKRIAASGKPAAWAKLAEVMGEHQNFTDAILDYNKAIELDPKNPEFYKGRAIVEEGKKDLPAAKQDWEKVLALLGTKPTDRLARREARKRYVSVLVHANKDVEMSGQWRMKFAATPPDPEAGYLLVEYFAKRPQQGEPLATLKKLVTLVPDDQDAVLDLVKEFRRQHQYDEAVAMLLDLAKKVPSREREVYQQISEIKTEARQDDEAIEWQQKALAKSPTDPSAYERLGERYVEMQRFPEAIAAYEKTVQLDPRNSKAAFALAQLYVQNGAPMKATELYRNVLRTATDDEVVARAGKLAIDLEEMTDTLGELEKVVSPLSFMMAHKPVYRRVLVDLYVRYVPRLVERVRHGSDEVKRAARAELDRVGAHGLRPLLEALRDDKEPAQQRLAVRVLGSLGNKGAAPPLVHLARQEPPKDPLHRGALSETGDREMRVDALVAAGRLGDADVLADVLPLAGHDELGMREAATFTLGRSTDRRAVPTLVKALADRHPPVQQIACLGLAQIDDPKAIAAVIATVRDTGHSDAVRAACAYAIGVRRASAGVAALLAAVDDNRGETQRMAAWALGQLGEPRALGPLVRAYFARAGGASDELVWAIGRTSGAGLAPSPIVDLGEFPMRAGVYDDREAMRALPGALPRAPATARLVIDHAADIAAGLDEALTEHRDVVVSVLADLDAAPDRLALGALTPEHGDAKLAAALERIASAIEPKIAPQLAAEDPKVRALAVSVIAKLDSGKGGAEPAITAALADPAEQVRAAAMAAIPVLARRRGTPPPALVQALVGQLGSATWGDRRQAALALGGLGAAGDVAALVKAAADPSSFVREAVAIALGQVGGAQVRPTLEVLAKDPIMEVRKAADRAIGSVGH
ncbi:MAG TPA: tetratricopeptide repeat protein [Kofleriaceae bacterium]|nr:tetratricopeptide repeat protein [Kofleriaceae bacterium]